MDLGNIKAAVSVVRTIREDWPIRAVEGQVTELADNYPHPDVLYVCVAVAEDKNNQFASTLTMRAPTILDRLHSKTATVRTRNGSSGRRDDSYLCDVCTKPERDCQTAATNLNGADHPFKTIAAAEIERERQRYVRQFPQSRDLGIGVLPADVTTTQHPEPQQEEEAS